MTFSTASAGSTLGYFGGEPGGPRNCARIASMKSLRTNPSLGISVLVREADVIWIGAEVAPPDAGYSVLPNMGVLSPFYGYWVYVRGSWPSPVCLQKQQMRTDASHQRRLPLKDLI
jgi:hypothetical protein